MYPRVQAMHLVYKALEKYAIPSTLPSELMPPAKRKGSTPLGSLDGVKMGMTPPVPPQPAAKPVQTVQPQVCFPLGGKVEIIPILIFFSRQLGWSRQMKRPNRMRSLLKVTWIKMDLYPGRR